MDSSYKIKLNNNETLLDAYRDRNTMGDVTIRCKDGVVKAHRMVLISHSKFMLDVLMPIPFGSPATVILDYFSKEVDLLIDLLYKGEVNVECHSMGSLTDLMDKLKIDSSGYTRVQR